MDSGRLGCQGAAQHTLSFTSFLPATPTTKPLLQRMDAAGRGRRTSRHVRSCFCGEVIKLNGGHIRVDAALTHSAHVLSIGSRVYPDAQSLQTGPEYPVAQISLPLLFPYAQTVLGSHSRMVVFGSVV